MITSKSGYDYADVSGIPVEGKIMPVRENERTGERRILKAEDMAFLLEGYHEREHPFGSSTLGWYRFDGYKWPTYSISDHKIRLAIRPEFKRVFNCIASMYGVRTSKNYSNGTGYLVYVNPDKATTFPAKFKLTDYSVDGKNGDDMEDEFIEKSGLRQAFAPVNAFREDDAYVKRRDLDLVKVRNAFWDLKRLQYLLVPATLEEGKSYVTMDSVAGYEEDNDGDGEHDYDYDDSYTRTGVKIHVYPKATHGGTVSVSFPDIGCYCLCSTMGSSESSNTLYMSEQGNTNVNADSEGITCCCSSVSVYAEDNMRIAWKNDWEPKLEEMKKTVLVLRAWHRVSGEDGSGSNPTTMDSTYYVRCYGCKGRTVDKDWVSPTKCRELLSDAGYPETIDEHPDPAHTESVGVDLVGLFVLAKPKFDTDLTDVNCPH